MKLLRTAVVLFTTVVFMTPNIFAGDTKYYSEYVLKYKVNDKFDIFFTPEMRFRNDMSTLYYYQMRGGVTFHAHKYLDLSGAYRYLQTKNSKNQWNYADAQYYEMIAIPRVTVHGFELSDANKFEYRIIENARDRWVYRNLSTIAYPTKIGNFAFSPYVSEEFYYDFEINRINLNWATIGLTKKIMKNLSLGLYYRVESVRTGSLDKWTNNSVIGTNVSLSF